MTIQIAGSANSTIAEVETTSLARRTVLRSNDTVGPLVQSPWAGSYKLSAIGTPSLLAVGWSPTNTPIFGVQWKSFINLLVVKKIILQCAVASGGSNTAGVVSFNLFRAVSYQQQYDTFVNSALAAAIWQQQGISTVFGGQNKLRNTFSTSDLAGAIPQSVSQINPNGNTIVPVASTVVGGNVVVAHSTTALTIGATDSFLQGGNVKLEANPFASFIACTKANAFFAPPPTVIFDAESYGHPMVFENETGFVCNFTYPGIIGATNSNYIFGFDMLWDEVPYY